MKTIFATDLHGDLKQYGELARLIRRHDIELLLLGGDLAAFSREAQEQIRFAENAFADFVRSISIPVMLIPGNIEWTATARYYEELARSLPISILSLTPLTFRQFPISGYPFCNPTPFRRKDFERRDRASDSYEHAASVLLSDESGILAEQDRAYLNRLPSIEDDLASLTAGGIWVMHAPPYGTKLDMLDSGGHAGSRAIRRCIEELQPMLTLHGHIHESPYKTGEWADRIGDTICINPGRGESLHAVLLTFQNERLESAEHIVFGKAIFA
ncbi:metallophosphoesterase family protein [Paenibacillus ginsengarvi]|uniref:metallophosphoesterase family protein n=1 Tax=Paenibacillus ginsengarvi TaxID=400777 RepID=UPI0013153D7E|nr:metallophosphoesterase [Paenibacillus ginsengarvi]